MKWILLIVTTLQFTNSWSQPIKIGIIDFYGNRKTTEATLRKKLIFKEGDLLSPEQARARQDSALQQLTTIKGVQNAVFDLVCCDDKNGQYMLFVGIDEGDQLPIIYRQAPDSALWLPADLLQDYQSYNKALFEAVQRGATSEDHDQGHALSNDSALRQWQYKFIEHADKNFQQLRTVLYKSSDPSQRAAAAHIIAYASDKKKLLPVLFRGVSDPDDGVRNNAARALAVLAVYAQLHPEKEIVIPAGPFIMMINSITWTDRNKGAMVLLSLSQNRDKELLNLLKKEALPALTEMARWKNPGHTFFPMMILGRMAGIEDEEIYKAISSGNKEALLQKIKDKL